MEAIRLRDYQRALVNDIRSAMRGHPRVLAVAPTGSGKTVCFAYITAGAHAKGKRCFLPAIALSRRTDPREVEGELVRVSAAAIEQSGRPKLRLGMSLPEIQDIGRHRGYRPGWAQHQYRVLSRFQAGRGVRL